MKNRTTIIIRSVLFALIYVVMYKFAGIEFAVCGGIGQILAEISVLNDNK